MSRYATFRIVVFLAMIALLGHLAADTIAQATPPASEAPVDPDKPNMAKVLFGLILNNIDFVFVIIGVLSVVGLTLIIQGFIKNRQSVFMPEATTARIRDMIANRQFTELIDFTENDPSFVSRAINPALKRAPSFPSMKEAMETAIGEQTAESFRRIEYLNIIGNLGPLLGLLGTVLGMIEAFDAMNRAGGNANPAQLAGGISKALAHTFLGLFLAVPCLAAFGVLRTMVDRLTVRGALISEELLLMIKPSDAKPAAAAAVPRVAAPAAATPPPARRGPTPQPGQS